MTMIIGKEVMIDDQSTLTLLETDVLLRLSDGETQRSIRETHDLSLAQLTQVEFEIRKKLSATTLPHAISRAFQLGIMRTLCMIICFMSLQHMDDARRTRTPTRGGRIPSVQMRLRSGSGGREVEA